MTLKHLYTHFWVFLFLVLMSGAAIAQDSIRTLRVACDYAYYPYEFIDKDLNPNGFDIDIIKAIAKDLNYHIDIKAGNWTDIKQELIDGRIDIIAGMYYKVTRAENVNFSLPYIIITHSLFVKKGDYWNSLKDVKDDKKLKIIVENSSVLHKYLNTAGIENNRIIAVEDQFDVLQVLSETPNTCAVLPKLQGEYTASKHGFNNIITVGLPILPREYSVAINKKDTALLNDINNAITNINNSGAYQRIYNKWFGKHEHIQPKEPKNSMVEYVFLFILSVISFIYIFKYWHLKNKKNKLKTIVEQYEKKLHLTNSQLIESETLLRKITEYNPYPIALIRNQGEIYYINNLFEKKLQLNKKDIPTIDIWIKKFFPDPAFQEKAHVKIHNIIHRLNADFSDKESERLTLITQNNKHENLEVTIHFASLGQKEIILFFEKIERV